MSVQDGTICGGYATQIEDDVAIDSVSEAIGGEVVRALLRHDDEVSVRDAVAVDEIADALERKCRSHPPANGLRNHHDVRGDVIGQVGEMIDMRVRNDDALAGRGRLERHEG